MDPLLQRSTTVWADRVRLRDDRVRDAACTAEPVPDTALRLATGW
jgi:hypothetical protein